MSGRARRRPRPDPADEPRRRGTSDLGNRILVAVPAALFAVAIVVLGGTVLLAGLCLLGVLALRELYSLMRRARPVDLAGFVAVIGMVVVATYSGQRAAVLIPLVAVLPIVFLLALTRPRLDDLAWGISATVLGVVWIGLPLAHAVFLRELPHGDGLLLDVLVGTFIGDTAAYLGGRLYGRRPLAPDISPNKTVEGLAAGVAGGTFAFWFAALYQDWFGGWDALAVGLLVAVSAPLGDLFESAVKRDLAVKDTGRVFGAHGGVLDRLDAVFFSVVLAYYGLLALGYG